MVCDFHVIFAVHLIGFNPDYIYIVPIIYTQPFNKENYPNTPTPTIATPTMPTVPVMFIPTNTYAFNSPLWKPLQFDMVCLYVDINI